MYSISARNYARFVYVRVDVCVFTGFDDDELFL